MRRWVILGSMVVSLVAVDQATKYLAVRDLTVLFQRGEADSLGQRLALFYGERGIEHLRRPPAEVFSWWRHVYRENPGAAFGLLSGRGLPLRLALFGAVTVLSGAFVIAMARRLEPERILAHISLGCILGGVVGNFVCRVTRGYVIDYVDWSFEAGSRIHWPTFNVADVGITFGVAVLIGLTVKEVARRDA